MGSGIDKGALAASSYHWLVANKILHVWCRRHRLILMLCLPYRPDRCRNITVAAPARVRYARLLAKVMQVRLRASGLPALTEYFDG